MSSPGGSPEEIAARLVEQVLAEPRGFDNLKKALRDLGFDIKPSEKKWPWATPWLPDVMRKRGLSPATVIDVGAGRGTPALYEAFPEAYHVLIEPIREFESTLQQIVSQRRGEYRLVAVGATEGVGKIRVNPRCLLTSTMSKPADLNTEGPQADFESREIPLTTLDRLLEDGNWTPPFGLKIDVEGFEGEVVEGATRLLEQTQFVISELWLSNWFNEGGGFPEFVDFMYSHGFELCDILDAPRPKPDREMVFIDAMFWRRPSELAGRLP
jgi:FkbM family methyltransferase